MKQAFVFSEEFFNFDYGPSHPLRMERLKLAHDLMEAYGLFDLEYVDYIEAKPASMEEVLRFHKKEYLEILKIANKGKTKHEFWSYGLGPGDNPVFKGLLDWSLLAVGASLQATRFVESGRGRIAFNMAGGLHHAMESRASGFCYLNDPVIAIYYLLDKGYKVAYIDIDAHHGDGVQWAFYETDSVLTISFHQSGQTLFPGTGSESELGRGKGLGYAVNIPLWPGTNDEILLHSFMEIVPPLIKKFQPDFVVTQLGVDTFEKDPLANLCITTEGFCKIIRWYKNNLSRWIALGGGGYDLFNVARAWTLAWAIMIDRNIEDELPEEFRSKLGRFGYHKVSHLRDLTKSEKTSLQVKAKDEAERVVGFLKRNLFPLWEIV